MSDNDHSHSWWATPGGAFLCACGAARRPMFPLLPSLREQAVIDRFGIFDEEAS